MDPFENLHAESDHGEDPRPPAPRYTRHRHGDGRFAGVMLNVSEGVSAEVVSKGLMPKPMTTPKMPKPPTPAGVATAPKLPRPQTVPSSSTMNPGRPKVRQTGIGKSWNGERGDLMARQFSQDKQVRVSRSRDSKVFTRERLPRRVKKSMPDQSEVHVMGGDLKPRRIRRPRYPQSVRRVG